MSACKLNGILHVKLHWDCVSGSWILWSCGLLVMSLKAWFNERNTFFGIDHIYSIINTSKKKDLVILKCHVIDPAISILHHVSLHVGAEPSRDILMLNCLSCLSLTADAGCCSLSAGYSNMQMSQMGSLFIHSQLWCNVILLSVNMSASQFPGNWKQTLTCDGIWWSFPLIFTELTFHHPCPR